MTRKRDGPAPQSTATGPRIEGRGTRPSLAPPANPAQVARPPPPPPHRRQKPRQAAAWRGFAVRLYPPPGHDSHALYALLRLAAKRFGLEVGGVDEIYDPARARDDRAAN